jgi:hypothetical protein
VTFFSATNTERKTGTADILKGKKKINFTIAQAVNAQRQSGIIALGFSLTSNLDGSGWSIPRPGRVTTEKETWYSFHRRLGGPQGTYGRMRKIAPHRDPFTGTPIP